MLRFGILIAAVATAVALIGCGGSGASTLDASDTQATEHAAVAIASASLAAAAVDAGSTSPKDLLDATYPFAAVRRVLDALSDKKADTVIKDKVVAPNGQSQTTVSAYLAKLANDVEAHWPDEVAQIDRVRESLPN